MKQKILAAMAAVCSLAAGPALALNMLFLSEGPAGYFTEEDNHMFDRTLQDALNDRKDGEVSSWSNPASGASGKVTVMQTFTREGMTCRELKIFNSAKGRTGQAVFDLCKVPDGRWKIASFPKAH
jgi:surface antigen